MAEVVGAELELESVGRAAEGGHHHAGVVDQEVDLALPIGGELPHGGEAREVESADLPLAGHRRGGRLALLEVAHGENHMCACAGEGFGGGATNAAVGTRDDHLAALHARK